MERDHYMDWLVSGLENSNQARLPMWLLIIRIYWKDLLRSRRMGRRLVTAALSHHASVSHVLRDLCGHLSPKSSPNRFTNTRTTISSCSWPRSYSPSLDVCYWLVHTASYTPQRGRGIGAVSYPP